MYFWYCHIFYYVKNNPVFAGLFCRLLFHPFAPALAPALIYSSVVFG